jgi:tripartite-type tricarboxylate transporter receptor subunit TctC
LNAGHPIFIPTVFAPVGIVAQSSSSSSPARIRPATTLPEFIACAKTNRAKMQYAAAGIGSNRTCYACVLLNFVMGIDITTCPTAPRAYRQDVPYRSTVVAIPDMRTVVPPRVH